MRFIPCLTALTLLALPAAVPAQTASDPATAATAVQPVEFTGSFGPFFRERSNVAIPSYAITFITQQEATAVRSMDARVRLNTMLAGVDEALMRQLVNEAHADLIAQLSAAGIATLDSAGARALVAGATPLPGNIETRSAGRGITIGRSVRRGYTAVGADGAPLLQQFHSPPYSQTSAMQAIGISMRMGGPARSADAVALFPALVIDYINLEASTGGGAARAAGEVNFAVRGLTSSVKAVSAGNSGPGYQQGITLRRDVDFGPEFATVVSGGAEVRDGTMTRVTDNNYQQRDRARGDAIVADPARWSELVRAAFRSFNAGLVARIQADRARQR